MLQNLRLGLAIVGLLLLSVAGKADDEPNPKAAGGAGGGGFGGGFNGGAGRGNALAKSLGIQPKSDTIDAADLKDGFSKTYDLPTYGQQGSYKFPEKVHVWVEQGWLNVRSTNEHGRIDWQVALAQPDEKLPLQVSTDLGFRLQYGHYFVRDGSLHLRLFRQFKEADSPPWPEMKYDGDKQLQGMASGVVRLQPAQVSLETKHYLVGDWHWVQSGPSGDHPDVWIRVEHNDLARKTSVGGGAELMQTIGDRKVTDEGDLLTADHNSIAAAEHRIDLNNARTALKTKPVPELDCSDWQHTDNGVPVAMEALRGSVVLLDFWGGGFHTGNGEQSKLEALYQKYKDRGLMVVAVHSNNMGKRFADLLKEHEFSFPAGLEHGDTATRYGVDGYPTILLIDKQGMVKGTFIGQMPSESNIEKLLNAE